MIIGNFFLFQVDNLDSPINLGGKPGNIIELIIKPDTTDESPTISNVVIKACFEEIGKLSLILYLIYISMNIFLIKECFVS